MTRSVQLYVQLSDTENMSGTVTKEQIKVRLKALVDVVLTCHLLLLKPHVYDRQQSFNWKIWVSLIGRNPWRCSARQRVHLLSPDSSADCVVILSGNVEEAIDLLMNDDNGPSPISTSAPPQACQPKPLTEKACLPF